MDFTLDELIVLLENRGWGDRDRLIRKTMEELGEYVESVEYLYGSSGKVEKFKGKASPQEKLHEEICDVIMMALALAHKDGLSIDDVLKTIHKKLYEKETAHQAKLKEISGDE